MVQAEDALCWDAGHPPGIAAVTNYDGAGPAAEFEVILSDRSLNNCTTGNTRTADCHRTADSLARV